jgi:hypothetical protein
VSEGVENATGEREGRLNWPQADWFAERPTDPEELKKHNEDTHEDNLYTVVDGKGATVPQVLQALTQLVARHESLRTLLSLGGNSGDRQRVTTVSAPAVEAAVSVSSVQAAEELFTRVRHSSFELSQKWPFHAVLSTTGGRVEEIDLVTDHSAVDGWGMSVLRKHIDRAETETVRDELLPGAHSIRVAGALFNFIDTSMFDLHADPQGPLASSLAPRLLPDEEIVFEEERKHGPQLMLFAWQESDSIAMRFAWRLNGELTRPGDLFLRDIGDAVTSLARGLDPPPARREVVQDEHLAAHRIRITSPWRGLTAGCQALLVLAHLQYGDTYSQLPAWFGVGIATMCRYVHGAVAIPENTPLLQISDRVAADRPYCSQKASSPRRPHPRLRRPNTTHAKPRCVGQQATATLQGPCGPRTWASVPSIRRGTSAEPAWATAGVPAWAAAQRPGARPGSR